MTNDSRFKLPEDFDGVFRFTNWTDEDFKAKWDGIEYTFPARKMTPMTGINATPVELQNIRKKFARELAVAELYKTKKFKGMDDRKHGQNPAIYTDSDLAEFTRKCLEPLEIGKAGISAVEKPEISLSVDQKGRKVTKVLDDGESLIGEGIQMR